VRSKDTIEKVNSDGLIRLNKFLSDAGVCSRREADRLIETGKVTVDGEVAVMGTKITLQQEVVCDGKKVQREERLVLIALNKPVGVECTTDMSNPDNVVSFVDYPMRIYPVGRLDKDTEGLLLLTNSGAIVNKIMKASTYHEKEYVVTVDKPINEEFINKMSGGVPILDTVTRPCTVKKIGKNTFTIILTQGLNRQIRRMCEFCGFKVIKLKRIRIMNINLGGLKTGAYRDVTDEEIKELLSML